MANLYTYMIKAMKNDPKNANHHVGVVKKLDGVLKVIKDLQEDPLFISNIHGEQELSLDQTIELLKGIRVLFLKEPEKPEFSPSFETESFDIS